MLVANILLETIIVSANFFNLQITLIIFELNRVTWVIKLQQCNTIENS